MPDLPTTSHAIDRATEETAKPPPGIPGAALPQVGGAAGRTLLQTARDAGAAMIELLLRFNDERRLGTHLREGSSAMGSVDTMIALHWALIRFQRVTQRRDGHDIARAQIEHEFGEGVADLVLISLAETHRILTSPTHVAGTGPSQQFIDSLDPARFDWMRGSN
jgi:hypothetical protein